MNVSGEALLNTVETVVRRIHSSNQSTHLLDYLQEELKNLEKKNK